MKKAKRAKKKDLRQIAFTRFMLIVAVMVIWIGGISVRLVHLQVSQHSWLRERALDVRQDMKQTRLLRGTIYDRNERALAMSLRVKTLYADPAEIADPETTGRAIAKALELDANQTITQLRQAKEAGKRFVPLIKKIDDEAAQRINKRLDDPQVRKADLPNFVGLHWRDEQRRSYPYQRLAAQVIGFTDAADDGKAGIEQSQDDALHGAVIKRLQERDRLGRVYDETVIEREAPSDIVLTIDAAYQYIAEQALERGVRASSAKSGMAVVMVPKTGAILALANYPTFDPNTIIESEREHIMNKAVQTVYSPGSVFKIVTYGSALEKGLFSPEDQIDSGNGTIDVANHVFKDSHAIGRVSYIKALAHSSNVCAIKTGLRVGKDDFFAMMGKMGFGSRTGVELPGETSGIVRSPDRWNGDSLASMSIGYEIGVTALQMTTAFATIANDGVRAKPHIIKEIRRANNQPKVLTETVATQVVTQETARHLRTMLREVVVSGTGRRAQLDGYTAAGKTGTAWKFNPATKAVDPSKYVSSFIGMAPADQPEIVIGIVMDEPKAGSRDGGGAAAPVFREIAQRLLTEMKVEPDARSGPDALTAQVPPAKRAGKGEPKANGPGVAEKDRQADKPRAPKRSNDKKPLERARVVAAGAPRAFWRVAGPRRNI
jgi:cell division protein FtsI (penicillin-binding protein 3)